jgi:hypothetical protein|tara:strand:+ start:9599 stop:9739 length:141 start_codon:yes stop_codon:yes gene_type:complete
MGQNGINEVLMTQAMLPKTRLFLRFDSPTIEEKPMNSLFLALYKRA